MNDDAPRGFERVQLQSECDPEGTGWCHVRDTDPALCDCIGPNEPGVEYVQRNGVLFGRQVSV